MQYKGYLIHSESMGLFLGQFMGLCFWSKAEDGGQIEAPYFRSVEEARRFIDAGYAAIPSDAQLLPVTTNGRTHANFDECTSAGVAPWGDAVPIH